MMTLFVLRHGIAEDIVAVRGRKDADRALTSEGIRKVRRIARAMRALEIELDLMLSSPLVRARQTAEIVAEALGVRAQLQLREELAPDGDCKELIAHLRQIRPVPSCVLVVGHEPGLSRFVSVLLAGTPEVPITLKKGGLCRLSIKVLRAGRCATLEWLLTPRQMALMKQG